MKRFIFWDYPRASFPYDIMVALILAFIFLTPAELFSDRPRPTDVNLLPNGIYMIIGPDEFAGKSDAEKLQRASSLVRRRFPNSPNIVKVEPFGEQEVKGFMAYTKP